VEPLPPDEVHLWYVRTDAVADPALLSAFEASLCAEERRRWQRFSFEEGRRQFLVSHGFLRAVLSRYAAVAPADWRFTAAGHGKPEVAPPGPAWLRFNLTHTRGLAACAVASGREVGVDAEDWHRQGRGVSAELVRRCLSPGERAHLGGLPEAERQRTFFDYWTLKEAYLKARGLGLALPLEEITFRWPPVVVSFGPGIGDAEAAWQFERREVGERHKIAVAVRRGAGPDPRVVAREFVPV
jgi:4'-phosphopantetheinyl transferase